MVVVERVINVWLLCHITAGDRHKERSYLGDENVTAFIF